jgi:hypothetical protein
MPPTDLEARIVQSHIWVPMDDGHVVNWMVTCESSYIIGATLMVDAGKSIG